MRVLEKIVLERQSDLLEYCYPIDDGTKIFSNGNRNVDSCEKGH